MEYDRYQLTRDKSVGVREPSFQELVPESNRSGGEKSSEKRHCHHEHRMVDPSYKDPSWWD